MKKLISLIILCLMLYTPVQGIGQTALFTLNTTASSIVILLSKLMGELFQPQYTNADKQADEFIKNIVQERGLKDIKIYVDKQNISGYSSTKNIMINPGNIIILDEKGMNELSNLINYEKNGSISNDQTKLMNRHKASIHHELTHLKRNSSLRGLAISFITLTASNWFSSNHLERHIKSYTKKPLKWLFPQKNIRSCVKILSQIALRFTIMKYCNLAAFHFHSKYIDEPACDEGIPNILGLLKSGADLYVNRHNNSISNITELKKGSFKNALFKKENIIFKSISEGYLQRLAMYYIPTNWFNRSPLLCDLIIHARDGHPSDLRRALRFEERIRNLGLAPAR